jgi:tRNA(Ile)-lysidine synthase
MTGGGPPASVAAPLAGEDIDALFADWTAYPHIALAVSGGADSMALMILAHAWLARTNRPPLLTILTVDHRLRTEAAGEAALVKHQAEGLGLSHQTLAWSGPKPRADLQAAARAARYGLMLDFCRGAGIAALATAHTAEDQAETLLMRLARGSGVDGLAAISPISMRGDIALLRPLLGLSRMRLEATLLERGVIWIEDPSNHDKRLERVRVREALRAGGPLRLMPEQLACSARRLDRARTALDGMTGDFLGGALQIHPAGYGELPLAVLREAPEEIGVRAITCLAQLFGGGQRAVRLARVEALHHVLTGTSPRTATLGGCVFAPRGQRLRVRREYGRIDPARLPLSPAGDVIWDGRFIIKAPNPAGLSVGALGPDGVAQLRADGGSIKLPAQIAHSLPALWHEERLVFAPFAVFAEHPLAGWRKDASAVFLGPARLHRQAGRLWNQSTAD